MIAASIQNLMSVRLRCIGFFIAIICSTVEIPVSAQPPLLSCGLGDLRTCTIAPVGDYYASGGSGGAVVRLRQNGVIVRRLATLETVEGMSFSPDGRILATVGPTNVEFWDVASGYKIRTLRDTSATLDRVVYSHDGSRVLTYKSQGGPVGLWNLATGSKIAHLVDNWNGTTQGIGLNQAIRCAAFSPDSSRILTVGNSGYPLFWDGISGEFVSNLEQIPGILRACAFSVNYDIVIGSSNKAVYRRFAPNYLPTTPALTTSICPAQNQDSYDVLGVAFSSDGSSYFTYGDLGVRQFLLSGSAQKIYNTQNFSIQYPPNDVSFTRDGSYMLNRVNVDGGALQDVTQMWDTSLVTMAECNSSFPAGNIIREDYGHNPIVQDLDVTYDGRIALTVRGTNASLWSGVSGTLVSDLLTSMVLPGQVSAGPAMTGAIVFPSATKLITMHASSYVPLWTLGNPTPRYLNHLDRSGATRTSGFGLSGHAVDRLGRYVATGGPDGTIRVFDTQDPGPYGILYDGYTAGVNRIRFFDNDTKIIACGAYDGRTTIWDRTSPGTPLHVLTYPPSAGLYVQDISISPDDTLVCSVVWDTENPITQTTRLFVHNVQTGQYLGEYTSSGRLGGRAIKSAHFSKDGTQIIAAGNMASNPAESGLICIDRATSTVLWERVGHKGAISHMAISDDRLRAFTGGLDGQVFVWELRPARAVIVAGGGNYAGNSIAKQTDDLGAYAYRALRARGYTPENIQYLSAFGNRDADGNGQNDDVDGIPNLATTSETLQGAFAKDAGRLLVLMMDHGYRTDSFMGFRSSPNTILSSARLRTWLDTLQSNNPVDATVVVDSCYSGQMAQDLMTTATGPLPSGRLRTVVASTGTTAVAVFLPPPDLTSFMQTWLGSAYMGSSVGAAFQAGSDLFTQFPVAGQKPLIVSSDGTTSQGQAQREFFGASWAYGVQASTDADSYFPVFDQVATATTVLLGDTSRLWVRTLAGVDPTTVVATLRPPAPDVFTGDPVTTLPTFLLSPKPGDPREWEVTPPAATFDAKGVYRITYTAKFNTDRIARPGAGSVSVSNGPDPDQTEIRAVLAVGNSSDTNTNAALQKLADLLTQTYATRFQDNAGNQNPQWIRYYSPFNTPSLLPVSASASSFVSQIFPGTDTSCGRLFVHLAGESDSPGSVRLATGETIWAADLDTALDNLQARQTCEVVLVVDTPSAGHFAEICAKTGAQKRVVIVSGRRGDSSIFLANPPVSFSSKFLGAALQGASIFDALQTARAFFVDFLRSQPGRASEPILDDDGDANFTFADGKLAKTLYLGRRYAFADDSASGLPFVLGASAPQTRAPGSLSNPFTANLVEGVDPQRVFAVIIPPGFSTQTINGLPQYDLTRVSPSVWDWSGILPVPSDIGDYTVAMYAEYPDGSAIKVSAPAYTTLTAAPDPTSPDQYEAAPYFDSTSDTSNTLVALGTQVHTLHNPADEDWFILALAAFDTNGTSTSLNFGLRFSQFFGNTTSLGVEVTPISPTGSTQGYTVTPGGLETVSITATGAQVYKVAIRPLSLSSGQGLRYRFTIDDNRGGNNGIISQIGTNRTSIGWTAQPGTATGSRPGPVRFAASYTGWRVYRTGLEPASPRTLVATREWPATPGCSSGIPIKLQAFAQSGDEYFEVVDTYNGALTLLGFATLQYEIVPVTNGSDGLPLVGAPIPNVIALNTTTKTFESPYCAINVPISITQFEVE